MTNEEKPMLFVCDARHILLNMLLIIKGEHIERPCDLLLTDMIDWEDIPEKLERSGLFRRISTVEIRQANEEYAKWGRAKLAAVRLRPKSVMPGLPDEEYGDIWFSLAGRIPQLMFKHFARFGQNPAIHLVDEGTASYTLKPFNKRRELLEWSSAALFASCVEDIWLMRPELFSGSGHYDLAIRGIDRTLVEDPELMAFLLDLFQTAKLPEERYVWFEECYIRNHHTVNDLELLDRVAEVVGKENIIIRLHPKSEVDRFTPLGYKTMEHDSSLWELTCLTGDISRYVFATVKSSAVMSSLSLAVKPPKVIILNEIAIGYYPNRRAQDFKDLVATAQDVFGDDEAHVFMPRSAEELGIILDYLAEEDKGR